MLPKSFGGWAGGRVAFVLLVAMPLVAADAPLFPIPLHLVRHIEDPIANATAEVDEYCTGNKIITVSGSKTAIADYERGELLEIDRAAATYSVATFDEIAKAKSIADPPAKKKIATNTATAWKTTPLGVKLSRAGRSADSFDITSDKIKVEVAVDRQVTLSRAALDALIGAGFPNKPSDQQEAIAQASVRNSEVSAARVVQSYGLPLEQSITIEGDAHKSLTIRNTIIRITNELPPPELLAIPAGAKLVDSRAAKMQRLMKELGDITPGSQP